MKTHFNLRSTIGNSSWPQRGLAALAALAMAAGVGITLMLALRPSVQAVPAAPAAQVVNPVAPKSNVPISRAGSAYNGSAYVEYLLSGPSAAPAQLAASTPNIPVIGTGSAYNGGAYRVRRPAVPNPNVQLGTGLVSDGSAYIEYLIEQAARQSLGSAQPAAANPNVPIGGTRSAYDGGSYGTARPASPAQPIGLGINLPASVNLRELPTGLTDYVRQSP
jgi:hypothetical protein